jgi:hypothetical protein
MRQSLLLTLLALALGCGTNQDLGHSKTAVEAYLGSWEGYIENYQLPSGSDTIRMTITSSDGVNLTGTVIFGDADPPAPPTDPTVGYPTTFDWVHGFENAPYDIFVDPVPWDGFVYTPLQVELATERLRFKLSTREFWKAWAELQTPSSAQTCGLGRVVPDTPEGGPYLGHNPVTGDCVLCSGWQPGNADPNVCLYPRTPIDCGMEVLCGVTIECQDHWNLVDCTADGCTVPIEQELNVGLDMVVDGDVLSGSVAWTCCEGANCTKAGTNNVHLTRAL